MSNITQEESIEKLNSAEIDSIRNISVIFDRVVF
jgi:hypothetical protein